MLTLDIGGYLFAAILAGCITLLVREWWKFRSGGRR